MKGGAKNIVDKDDTDTIDDIVPEDEGSVDDLCLEITKEQFTLGLMDSVDIYRERITTYEANIAKCYASLQKALFFENSGYRVQYFTDGSRVYYTTTRKDKIGFNIK